MPKLYYMVGLPGSGKSRYAKELCDTVFCLSAHWDKMREQEIEDRNEVMNLFNKQVIDCLASGNDCAVDATNVKAKTRIHFLRQVLRGVDCEKICIVMATPYLRCIKDAGVRKDVVDEYYHKWETPLQEEGFDEVWLHYEKPEWIGLNGNPFDLPKFLAKYNQESPYHMRYLGDHLAYTYKRMCNKLMRCDRDTEGEELGYAAVLHDCGKPFTKTYDQWNTANYYNHNNIGGYEALFFDCDDADTTYVSALVCHHMDPYFWTEPTHEMKFIKRFGSHFYNDIMILHRADKEAH